MEKIPIFLALRDWFGQLRSPEDERVFNKTGLSGRNLGTKLHLGFLLPAPYTNSIICTINGFPGFLQVFDIFLTRGNNFNPTHSSTADLYQITRIIWKCLILFQSGILS